MNIPVVLGGIVVALILMSITSKPSQAKAEPESPPKPKPAPTKPATTTITIASPWKDVSAASWTRFVKAMAGNRAFNLVTKNNFFGAFGFGVRRLVDLKIMKDPVHVGSIWQGEWIIPKETFLGSPSKQYEALAQSMVSYRKSLIDGTSYKNKIGTMIEGKKASLSGLLAVAHMAGGRGLYRWIDNPSVRQKLSFQTEAYLKANGLF